MNLDHIAYVAEVLAVLGVCWRILRGLNLHVQLGRFIFALLTVSCMAQADGPATLPRSTPSTVAVSPNAPKVVSATDNLQAAINAASCGDTFNVDPTWTGGSVIVLSLSPCDVNHWLTVQDGAAIQLDTVTGWVLPGQQLPKIVGHVTLGSFVVLRGFEITRPVGIGPVGSLISVQSGAHDFILDMDYVHGTKADETTRGLELSGSTRGTIENSYFSGFHCMAGVGSCTDSQSIHGGCTGSGDEGVFAILNSHLEGTESILFGGCPAAIVPHDITIVGNTLTRPLSWNPADPSYAPVLGKDGLPHPWTVKNCLELKNAAYVLVSGVTCENVWGGFSQNGFAFLLTAKNQATPTGNVCPICSVHDVTFRNSLVRHTGGAMQIGFGPAGTGWPDSEYNISAHDIVFDDQNGPTMQGTTHWLLQITSGASPTGQVLHDVSISNTTLNVPAWHGPLGPTDGKGHGILILGGPTPPSPMMYNIHVDSNIFPAGNIPIITSGGGPSNCAYSVQGNPSTIVGGCFTGNSSFSNNLILGSTVKLNWPPTTVLSTAGANVNAIP